MRDYQQSAVYAWEQQYVAPKDHSRVEFSNAKAIIDHIWQGEGLQYPPILELIHPNTKRWAGAANRLKIQLQPVVSTKTIIHELAHSMTGNIDEETAMHNDWFVGLYMRLLEKYLRLPLPYLMFTANKAGVDFNIMAHPVFLD